MWAVEKGHVSMTTLLLDEGADPERQDKRARGTALHLAVEHNSPVLVDTLLAHGANLTQVCDRPEAYGDTGLQHKGVDTWNVLHVAAFHGHAHIVTELIKKRISVESKAYVTPPAPRPLHIAVHEGHQSVIDALLENGADINAVTNPNVYDLKGSTALAIEVDMMSREITRQEVEDDDENDMSGALVLHPMFSRPPKLLEHLLTMRANPNIAYEKAQPLVKAIRGNVFEAAELLISYRADVAPQGESRDPLQEAVMHGKWDMVRLLICNGATRASLAEERLKEGNFYKCSASCVERRKQHLKDMQADGSFVKKDCSEVTDNMNARN